MSNLSDAICLLDEANEGGDLEERFDALLNVADLERDRDTWKVRAESAEQVIDELHEEIKSIKENRYS